MVYAPLSATQQIRFVMIPPFDERGNLPPGIHKATWNEVEIRFGQSPKRRFLLTGLREALTSLQRAGCHTAYLNGSFTTAKEEPGDFDACWAPMGVDLEILDPLFLDFSNGRQAQSNASAASCSPQTWSSNQRGFGSSTSSSASA